MDNIKLESPIDTMYLIHKALRAEARRVENVVSRIEEGESLQPFRQAFYRWVTALAYHADTEDMRSSCSHTKVGHLANRGGGGRPVAGPPPK